MRPASFIVRRNLDEVIVIDTILNFYILNRANCKTPWAWGYSGLAVSADMGFCKFALGQTAEWPVNGQVFGQPRPSGVPAR